MGKWISCLLVLVSVSFSDAQGVRLKDIANLRGVRDNQLIGYGIVVGLNGTGDSKLEYTSKSVKRMLDIILGLLKIETVESESKRIMWRGMKA